MAVVTKEIQKIGKFLQNSSLRIPPFQRPYKWTVKNVVQLIEDIQRFKPSSEQVTNGKTVPYRIGTIVICKEDGSETYDLVDGQQRSLTFLLMFKAIYKMKIAKSEKLRTQLEMLQLSVFKPFFQNVISQQNIQNNYLEIERRLAGCDDEFIDYFLNHCEVTYFVIDDVSEAFQFFDSQNARGRDLEPHDLLKAFHLRELNRNSEILTELEIANLVDTWEEMDAKKLGFLFADFLFRVRGWSKGNSSRYFTKNETNLFKGINLERIEDYPFVQMYKHTSEFVKQNHLESYPFQLDQIIINGKNFFQMISYYSSILEKFKANSRLYDGIAGEIVKTIDTYKGKDRTGDKYVRMIYNCALVFYVDKFGESNLPKAIEKIFIWSYSLRLIYESLQMASVDNYIIQSENLFKKIREAIAKEEILNIELPFLSEVVDSDKTIEIKNLFIKLKYCNHVK